MARVHDANAFTHAAIVNSGDVTTAEGEDDFNSFFFEDFCDQPAAMDHAQGDAPFCVANEVFFLCLTYYMLFGRLGVIVTVLMDRLSLTPGTLRSEDKLGSLY